MGVLLDTHAWLWWASDPERLGEAGGRAIAAAETIGVASISCWEVAMLALKGRIELDREPERWIRQALALPGIRVEQLSPRVAVAAAMLDGQEFPGDPADRMIYATGRALGMPLITRDAALREFDPRGTLW